MGSKGLINSYHQNLLSIIFILEFCHGGYVEMLALRFVSTITCHFDTVTHVDMFT